MRADMQSLLNYIQKNDYSNFKMIDSEDIIRAVEKFRAIWDLADEGYHNKNLKDDAWNGVCMELISDWKDLCQGEKYIKQMELKKKWNNIKDYYKKLLSETRSGEVRAKKRRYLYSDILEFIRPVYDKRRHESVTNHITDSSNISSHSNNAESDEQQHSENDRKDMETVTFIGIPTKCTIPKRHRASSTITESKRIQLQRPRRTTRPQPKMKRPMTIFERSILKCLDKKTPPKEEDPDLLFLKSLLPDMKKLTSTQKFDFKLGIMELYRNISASRDEAVADQDDEFDLSLVGQVKVETVRLSGDEDSYHSS